jgi:superoxide dismutase, Cu-Zn family
MSEQTHAFDSRGDTVRRITKAALGGLAGCALVLGGTQVASGALSEILKIHDDSNDLLTTPGPLDSAQANITIGQGTNSTTFAIRVTGIDPLTVDTTLGSHLHVGECVEGDGGAAGPHYNDDVVVGGKEFPVLGKKVGPHTAEVSPNTEVWFDLPPDREGMAYDETTVPFVPVDPDGVMSIVVHVLPTNPETGAAGTRQACFPLSVSGIFPTD